MSTNAENSKGISSNTRRSVHHEVLAALHPHDKEVVEALYDNEGRRTYESSATTAQEAVLRRYQHFVKLVVTAKNKPMPPPKEDLRPVARAPEQAVRFEEFTPEFEQALLACVIASPGNFNTGLLSAGCFNGSAMFDIAYTAIQFIKDTGASPTWLALEQLVKDYVKKRCPERLNEHAELMGEVRDIDTDGEMSFVVSRYKSWVKKQLLTRAVLKLTENLYGDPKEQGEAWEELLQAWHFNVESQIEDGHDLINSDLEIPPTVIEGILFKGHKMMLGGSSKSFKTFTLLDLALSVATGQEWWGFPTTQGRVLYANFEIDRPFFKSRLAAAVKAKGLKLEPEMFTHAYLRGDSRTAEEVLAMLKQKMRGEEYVLVVIDPLYKMLNGRNENAASEIASLLNLFSQFAEETGVAIAYGNHFSKGNQAGKESIDRVSGSGVFARDPDTIVTLTKHEMNDHLVAEITLRNSPPIESFCLRWEYPLMVLNPDADPSKLKKAGGRPKKHELSDLIGILDGGPLTTSEWRKKAEEDNGTPRSTFYTLKKELESGEQLILVKGKWQRNIKH